MKKPWPSKTSESEAALVKDFIDSALLFDPLAQISLIESPQSAAGFPDTCACLDGQMVAIEFKYCESLPKVRPSQVRWFKDNVKAKGRSWMMVQFAKHGFVLVPGEFIAELVQKKSRDLWFNRAELFSFDTTLSQRQWREFILALTVPF